MRQAYDPPKSDLADKLRLRKGALYVRPRGLPSTTEIASSVEMREVIDLASSKRLAEFFASAARANVILTGGPTDDEQYEQERNDGLGSNAVTNKIKTKGHWLVTVRPERYQLERLPYAQLEPVLSGAVVRHRGWPVPFMDYRQQVRRGDHWIGQDIDADTVGMHEAWRFFESGQFVHLRSVSAFWRTGSQATPVPAGHSAAIEVWEIILYLTEVFELAARLALETARNGSITVTAKLVLPPDTVLVGGYSDRFFAMNPQAHVAPTELGERRRTIATDQLAGQYGPPAAEMAVDFFNRFGWYVTTQNLHLLQRDLYD